MAMDTVVVTLVMVALDTEVSDMAMDWEMVKVMALAMV